MPGLIARALSPWLRPGRSAPGARVAALTGLSPERWRELARTYTLLPADPGPAAARARARLARLASRALSTGRWNLRLEGGPPSPEPCVYVTGHLGSMQALRYALRARGVAVANVLGPHNLDRTQAIAQDRVFDRRHALDFPHAFPSSAVHRLRSALKRGSLVAAADLPPEGGMRVPLLGGPALVDPRPFRLARAARVPCRPAFATMAGGRWTLTLGPALPSDERSASEAYAAVLSGVASRAPLDIDGVVYTHIAERCR